MLTTKPSYFNENDVTSWKGKKNSVIHIFINEMHLCFWSSLTLFFFFLSFCLCTLIDKAAVAATQHSSSVLLYSFIILYVFVYVREREREWDRVWGGKVKGKREVCEDGIIVMENII